MPTAEFGIGFVVALGLGALIGLEREHRRDETQVIAGVRTFPLMSIAGFMAATLTHEFADFSILAVTSLGAVAIVVAFLIVRHRLGVTGLTTPMAFLVTFFVGVFAGFGWLQEALVVGVVTTFLLLTKRRLHRFAFHLSDDEMMSALQFITVVFIVFPFAITLRPPVLGQDWVGRGAILDPYWILLIVIFVSSISFVSFLAMRKAGAARGLFVSGALGGLVSSEATTVSLATHAKIDARLVPMAVTGTLLATTTMLLRNLAIALFADPSGLVAFYMLPPLAILTLTGGWLAYRTDFERPGEALRIEVRSPFAIGPALRFAAIFAVVAVLQSLAVTHLGDIGVYVTALGGLVSAGAVIASVVTLYSTGIIAVETAVVTALLACLVGSANKFIVLRATNEEVYVASRQPLSILVAVGIVSVAGVAAWMLL